MVSATRPYTDAHAIARLDFALIFRGEIDAGAKTTLVDRLTSHLSTFGLDRVEPDEDDDDDHAIAFERRSDDEQVAEEVHVHENYVHVVWSDYRGWPFSRDGALERLQPVLSLLGDGVLELGAVGLAYHDVFLTDKATDYRSESVFRADTPLLAPFIIKQGATWRYWVDWIEQAPAVSSWRNRAALSIDVGNRNDDDGGKIHVTEVVHRQRLSPSQDGAKVSEKDLSSMWDQAHSDNRSLMKRLITDEMLELVGLKEGPNEHAMH
ncbi:hypothetical protein CEE60_02880 [Stenotrophomonas maltophilia]|uniref:TIGR04255 family protein n=1 Tax=Stenotrophomonas maltophilia TaxID=40324 RepID=A0A246HR33_STEMA|nr:hypothetical protein CEE60_02880 [Stenotrophomonas maltophilia]